jgi:hypothetical protein
VKLEITEDGLVFSEVYSGLGIQTPMGIFGIAQRDDGIEVLFTPPGGRTRSVFTVSTDLAGGPVFDDNAKDKLEGALASLAPRVAAYIGGPRMGKVAKPITGTISREEFIRAYTQYKRHGGQQDVEQLLNGGGFSYAELDALLWPATRPQSWIEGKLEALPQKDKLSEDQEDKLEDRANPVLLIAEFATITPKDKLEDPTTIESTGVVEKGAER